MSTLAERTEPVLQALRVTRAYLLSQRGDAGARHAASVAASIEMLEALVSFIDDLDRTVNAPSKVSA